MSCEEKFNAAVNVIRSLPKNGAYQPSHELMLRFYGYYKQATEGPNMMPKPNFWEVIKKAKWDAWSKLGNMPKEEAMMNYVEELKKIVETMAYTDNVANFLTSLDSFYESVPTADLEMLIGPVIEKVRSQPGSPLSGSPLASREASPHRLMNSQIMAANATIMNITSSLETSPTSSYSASPLPPDTDDEDEDFLDTVEFSNKVIPHRLMNSQIMATNATIMNITSSLETSPTSSYSASPLLPDTDDEDEDFLETVEQAEPQGAYAVTNKKKGQSSVNSEIVAQPLTNGSNVHNGNPTPRGRNREKVSSAIKKKDNINLDESLDVEALLGRFSEVLDPVNEAILSMRNDIEALKLRTCTHNSSRQMKVSESQRSRSWLLFQDLSIPTAIFFIVWPFLATLALQYIQKKQCSHH